MALLYQEIMKVPGLSGSAYQRQQQAYQRLGSPMGAYTGSYGQNIFLLGKLPGLMTPAPAPAPAPAGPAPKSAQQLYDEQVAAERAAIEGRLNAQKAEQEGLFGQYETTRKGQEALPAIYDRLQGELGVPGLSQTVQAFKGEIFKVKDLLDRLDEDVTTRTTGKFVNDSQRRRIIAAEGEDLRTSLGRLGTGLTPVAEALTSAQQEVGTRLQLTTAQQDRELEPLKMRINAIDDRFARELSGYSEQRQLTLDNLMDKLERERQLSDRDWELAQQLAAEEREFSRQKQLISARKAAEGGGGGYKISGPTTPARAQVRRLPSVSAPSGGGLQSTISGSALQGGGVPLQGGSFNLQGGGALNFSGPLRVVR